MDPSGAIEKLRCPACGRPVVSLASPSLDAVLGHESGACRQLYPVIGGIPRLVLAEARVGVARAHAAELARDGRFAGWSAPASATAVDLQIVQRFDEEWRRFSEMTPADRSKVFASYFDLVPPDLLGPGRVVLDAGCGSGRWAIEVAARGASVIGVDLGGSVEVAGRNSAGRDVTVIQADVRSLPLADGSFDLAYSLGVLHHIDRTEDALREIVRTLRPGGMVLVYLYYSVRSRGALFRLVFRLADAARRVISRSPHRVAVPLTTLIAAAVYLPMARLAGLARRIGLPHLAEQLPLSLYRDLSFRTMRNDSLDRFGTRLEKRFTREEVHSLLRTVGLTDVRISPAAPYWHATGRRP